MTSYLERAWEQYEGLGTQLRELYEQAETIASKRHIILGRLEQRLRRDLRAQGFSAIRVPHTPGFVDAMVCGSVEIGFLVSDHGIRVDITIPDMKRSQGDDIYHPASCGGTTFLSARFNDLVTGANYDISLAQIVRIVEHGMHLSGQRA